ncbi:hypothetical protein [Ornithinimicrobium pratense]|uniref:Cell wall-binding repeat-containing protein n=1 Tax=Ornithinimicrobium pratense TaxID=2593973 RepID=A0A5J6V504_9MICO|nr:hypothetical protein [Ornithinimicrobium pratense]QFG68093.1 hypothetical protein FY030_04625 [Ornithinimicrobium pratense]
MRSTARARATILASACAAALVLTACEGDSGDGSSTTEGGDGGRGGFLGLGGDDSDEPEPDPLTPVLAAPWDCPDCEDPEAPTAAVLTADQPDALSAEASALFFETAPVVVLSSAEEQVRAASAGVALGVPVLVDGSSTSAQLEHLAAEVALVVGEVADPGIDVVVAEDDTRLAELLGIDGEPVSVSAEDAPGRIGELDPDQPQLLVPESQPATDEDAADEDAADEDAAGDDAGATATPDPAGSTDAPEPLTSDRDELPPTARAEQLTSVALMSTGMPHDLAALGTAKAAGAHVLVGPHTDPRASSETVQALAGLDVTALVGLGEDFGPASDLAWKASAARTGVELPGGGQLTLPGKTYVALYGTPSTSALGVLGEQPIEETIVRAQEYAAQYEPLTDGPVVPTLEIIVTVASSQPEWDGMYSNELPVESLRPLVDLAAEQGVYVVLDLQPGRHDFVSQAQRYEELLLLPHVGLALDPEWRLGPDEVHMVRIGSVDVEEVNEVVDYLADLTREHNLPQKVLVLHMFQLGMITGVDEVDRSREEVAVLIHADGQGGQGDKQATWRALHDHAPSIEHWGWKNFYDEDSPMLTPEQTMSQVDPAPEFISYQ